jgi:DsbC/DsbD-like thiol-disulfide interchange protein
MLLASLVILLAGSVFASPSKPDPVTVELIPSPSTVTPGTPFTIGVLFKIEKGWHIYWKFAGDAGLPPEIKWKLPEGWKSGDIQWPIPIRYTEKGPLTTYGYSDSIMLLTEVTPSATLTAKSVTITAAVDWMVCHDECLPGKGTYSLTLPVGPDGSKKRAVKSVSEKSLAQWRGRVPRTPESAGFAVSVSAKKSDDSGRVARVTLNITPPSSTVLTKPDWFPSPGQDFAVKDIVTNSAGGKFTVAFRLQSFKGPIPHGVRLESLLVFGDASGKRRGLTITSPILFEE